MSFFDGASGGIVYSNGAWYDEFDDGEDDYDYGEPSDMSSDAVTTLGDVATEEVDSPRLAMKKKPQDFHKKEDQHEKLLNEEAKKFFGICRPDKKRKLTKMEKKQRTKERKEQTKRIGALPIRSNASPYDKLFGSMFMSSRLELERSNDNVDATCKFLRIAFERIQIPILPQTLPKIAGEERRKLPSTYRDKYHYYSTRASCVLEETRAKICDALEKQLRNPRSFPDAVHLELVNVISNKTTRLMLDFRKCCDTSTGLKNSIRRSSNTVQKEPQERKFTPSELYHLRPGGVFLLSPATKSAAAEIQNDEWPVLAFVNPNSKDPKKRCNTTDPVVTLVIFRKQVHKFFFGKRQVQKGAEVLATPLTSVISEVRQFAACMAAPDVPFLHRILGCKGRKHVRFQYGSDGELEEEEDKSGEDRPPEEGQKHVELIEDQHKATTSLNPSQEKAAKRFLNSPDSTLTLVQGPPGTGKTSFLVSVLERCLFPGSFGSCKRRVMVCAPTNYAVLVVAKRFLKTSKLEKRNAFEGGYSDSTLNVIMVGVEDKLMSDGAGDNFGNPGMPTSSCGPYKREQSCSGSEDASLRSIFVHSWLSVVVDQLQNQLCAKEPKVSDMQDILLKICSSIPSTLEKSEANAPMAALRSCLELQTGNLCRKNDHAGCGSSPPATYSSPLFWDKNIRSTLGTLISSLRALNPKEVTFELVQTADVLFCTLSSAGTSIVQYSRKIDDLLVDEAAAATESEVAIPYTLLPKRILLVGDPMQLPATMMSPCATDWGLDTSLHHRFMYDCKQEHELLDTQYRMHPEISHFPRLRFYDGNITDGVVVKGNNRCMKNVNLIKSARPYNFIQVAGVERRNVGGSYYNFEESNVVLHLLKELRGTYASKQGDVCEPWDSPDRIRVITFYQGQVSTLKGLLRRYGIGRVTVASVDSSQGCEADVVIISFVRSNNRAAEGHSRSSVTGFLTDNRRLNVALTRARHQLICVGDAIGTLRREHRGAVSDLANDAIRRGVVLYNGMDVSDESKKSSTVDSIQEVPCHLDACKRESAELATRVGDGQKKRKLLQV